MTTAVLTISIFSFSYRQGFLGSQDQGAFPGEHGGGYVFDCRCVPNPGRLPEYRTQTGLDVPVCEFLSKTPEANEFFESVQKLLTLSIEKYLERGFTSLSIAFGCTGGQHRSVYFSERLAAILRKDSRLKVDLSHLGRAGWVRE